jgi:putative ABC transport system permease protein
VTRGALFRYALREARGAWGLLGFFAACLAVGVAAVVSVAGLSDALDSAIRSEARRLLAADLSVVGTRPLPDELGTLFERAGVEARTDVRELFTIVATPPEEDGRAGASQLSQLKVVDGEYPFFGRLVLEPEGSLDTLVGPRRAVVAPELAETLGIEVGDEIRIGGASFEVSGLVLSEPDRVVFSFAIAPRVFLSAEGLERADLLGRGSRVTYRALARVPDGTDRGALSSAQSTIEEGLPDSSYYRVETYVDAQPTLRRGLERVERYVGLIALLSLLVGGVGVAQAIRAWIASRIDAIAVLRCLGVGPRAVMSLYLVEATLLGLAGSLVGVAAGVGLQLVAPFVLGDLLSPELVDPWQPAALLRGLALGLGVTLVFAIAPLAAAMRVPPARVFRREAEPLPPSRRARFASVAALLVGITGVASLQAGSLVLGAGFTVGIALVFGALAAAALVLARAVRGLGGSRVPMWARHGFGALARPGTGTMGAIVALGVGITVVLAMLLVERRVTAQLGADIPDDAPSLFFVDVQPNQWEDLRDLLDAEGARGIDSLPMVVGRLTHLDGVPVEELLDDAQGGRGTWTLRREQRLSFSETLAEDNELVAGSLWSKPGVGELSLEDDFARDMGAELGSVLTLDVQGVPLELEVTSLRRVDWQSFGINFFMLAEPEAVAGAPHTRVVTARVPPGEEQALQDAVAVEFPNVTAVRVRDILERVTAVLERLGLGVRILGSFAVLAGLAILGGAITASAMRRRREAALLKTLGLTRLGVVVVFAVEYALLGLVSGVVGCAGGAVLAWIVVTHGLQTPWAFEIAPILLALIVSGTLAVVGGLAASVRPLLARPAELLKAQ